MCLSLGLMKRVSTTLTIRSMNHPRFVLLVNVLFDWKKQSLNPWKVMDGTRSKFYKGKDWIRTCGYETKNPSEKLVGVVDAVSLTQNEMGPSNISFLLGWFCTMSMGECAWGIISHRIHLWYIYIWYVIYNIHLFTYIWLKFHGFHVGFQYTSHSHGSVMGISRFSFLPR